MLLQTCMTLLLLWKHKIRYFECFNCFCPYKKFQKVPTKKQKKQKNKALEHSSKYLLLCSTEERKSHRFVTTWGSVNYDIIFNEFTSIFSKLLFLAYMKYCTVSVTNWPLWISVSCLRLLWNVHIKVLIVNPPA